MTPFLFLAFVCLCNGYTHSNYATEPVDHYIYSIINTHTYNGSAPEVQRKDHGLAFVETSLYVLGGVEVSSTKRAIKFTEDVWAFDTEKGAWTNTQIKLERSQHCVAQNGTVVYIVGGIGNATNSFVSVNLTTGEWKVQPPLPAGHTSYPSCAVIEHEVIVFGGCDADGKNCSARIDIFDATTEKWNTSLPQGPSARNKASLNIIRSNKMYLGVIIGGSVSDTIVFYNFTDKNWTSVPAGDIPHLHSHNTVATAANKLIIFGGVLPDGKLSGETYLVSLNTTTLQFNVTTPAFNSTSPVARASAAAVFDSNRMVLYGGDYTKGESPSEVWQLAVEAECLPYHTCGECLLAGCFWCNPNKTHDTPSSCVAGKVMPYIDSTCTEPGWNATSILNCRLDHPAPAWLIAVTVVVLVLIAILVVATYIVDYKKGKASSGGYEPITGI